MVPVNMKTSPSRNALMNSNRNLTQCVGDICGVYAQPMPDLRPTAVLIQTWRHLYL